MNVHMKLNKGACRFDSFRHHCMQLIHSLWAPCCTLNAINSYDFHFSLSPAIYHRPCCCLLSMSITKPNVWQCTRRSRTTTTNTCDSTWAERWLPIACLGCWTIGDAGQTVGHGNFIRDSTRLRLDSESFSIAKRQRVAHVAPKRMPSWSYACCNIAPKVSDRPQPNSHKLFWVLPELVMDQSYAVCMPIYAL